MIALFAACLPAFAQHSAMDPLEPRASGTAYESAVRFRGIKRDVAYFDPTRPPPPLKTRERPARQNDGDRGANQILFGFENAQAFFIIIATALIIGLTYLFVRFGGRLPVSFSRTPQDGARGHKGRAYTGGAADQTPASLSAILAMPDRRMALVALCKSLLARSIAAQGVLFQQSWTDRDALRRVPTDAPHRAALQDLVYASERVQYGGRDVTENEFTAHVEQVRPLWTAATT